MSGNTHMIGCYCDKCKSKEPTYSLEDAVGLAEFKIKQDELIRKAKKGDKGSVD